MNNYQYTGINRYGKRVSGVIPANNEQELEQKLVQSKIDLLNYKKQRKFISIFGGEKITRKEVITLTFQLEQLLRAGVPLLEIIYDLKDNFDNKTVNELLENIHDSMQGGQVFSEALRSHAKTFGEVYISLVSVGEKTGQLEDVLLNLGNMLKWEDELASKAKKVMIYPAIVSTVVIAVVILMMLFVVPELLGFITSMGGELGIATKSLIATSEFVQSYYLELIIAPIVFFFAFKWLRKKSPNFTKRTDQYGLHLWVIGPVLYKLKLSRIANTLAVMYSAGVSFTESLRMCSVVAGNKYIEAKILQATEMIEEGRPINEAFDEAAVFPRMAVRMIKVGEVSGGMDTALRNVGYFYDREAKELIEKIEPSIEPVLTVIMGVVVGWVMIAVLGPIYDTISQVA